MISSLTVYDVGSPKLRLGCVGDGGYIINEAIVSNSTRLITLGYGNEDSFEIDWYKRTHTPIDIYDGTCVCGTICNTYPSLMGNTIRYHQRNVGHSAGYIPLSEILQGTDSSLLKVDIEGGEYSVFDGLDFSNQTGILIEFHTLQNPDARAKVESLLINEFDKFAMFHIHANNWTDVFDLNGVSFPMTIEISLINKSLIHTMNVDSVTYPITGLDYPNNHTRPEIQLPWVNKL